ncbi:sulfurtransferase [Leptospira idonii]|uniref:Sulfurtransferase n=1 Tax=Leptospira idonii TaxID=1193500 RepID=A0A4R9M5Y9_9LEPT|nr:sulfurtransferase [Leptospira idonii]TGN21097.1 sulfurtransferase [Leptospira idonii]
MKKIPILLFIIAFFAVGNCKKEKDDNTPLLAALLFLANQIKVNTVSELVNESNDDYAKNDWGLIESSKLESWVSNWPANKPSHISGKLIILQTDAANRYDSGAKNAYVKANEANGVYVYLLDDYQTGGTTNFRFNQTRDTGLVKNSVRYQANGAYVDEWLKAFGINLNTDLVVFAVGTTTTLINGSSTGGSVGDYDTAGNKATYAGGVQDIARGIYWLRYWGADIKHLALVNGNLYKNFSGSLTVNSRSTIPNNNGGFSVKHLRVDNTALTLGLENVIEIAKSNSSANVIGLTSKQLIVDARPTAQFNRTATGSWGAAGEYITTAYGSSGAPSNDATGQAKKYVLFEGNIKGAVTFPWANLLGSSANGFKFLSKGEIKTLFANAGYTAGTTIVSQCRTNFEAQVNGFASLNILGYPTAFYDGSLVEWTSLSAGHPVSALNKIAADSPFRTDTTAVSVFSYNTDNSRIQAAEIDTTATTTRKFIEEDKAYKQ